MPWSDSSAASPECDREEHVACPMWSPPGDGPPRLCACGCHRPRIPEPEIKKGKRPPQPSQAPEDVVPAVFEKLGIDVPPEMVARHGPEGPSEAGPPARAGAARAPGSNAGRLRTIGVIELIAGVVSLLGGATVMALVFFATGGTALYVASRQQP